MNQISPFSLRALLITTGIAVGFGFLLAPEDFQIWVLLWLSYLAVFSGVNAWRANVAIGALGPTVALIAVAATDPPNLTGKMLAAWIFMLLETLCVRIAKSRAESRGRSMSTNKDAAELVAVAARPRPQDASAADVLAHFGLENGGEQ
jgi:hypothetical protein